MKIELTESEYTFLFNLLKNSLSAIKNDISDIESDLLSILGGINKDKTKELLFQKQEFVAYRDKVKVLIKKIDQQNNNKIK